MGVSSFYKWIYDNFADIQIPMHSVKVDFLYLDFNAIIHNCVAPEAAEMAKTEEEVFSNIDQVVSLIMRLVRPSKLIYISVDGVAPRAKLNQQRANRYKTEAVKYKEELKKVLSVVKEEISEEGQEDNNEKLDDTVLEATEEMVQFNCENNESHEFFDRNAITPGTSFMSNLHVYLKKYFYYKQTFDPLWKHLNIIYSGYDVPGEGEQKILRFIKSQLNSIKFREARHVIVSPDADMIFLCLGLRMPYIYVMREDIVTQIRCRYMICSKCQKEGHPTANCGSVNSVKYIYADINAVRDNIIKMAKTFTKKLLDIDKLVDSWIFLSFFAGNDFIPTLECLHIKFNAIQFLTECFVVALEKTNKYLVEDDQINWDCLKTFLNELAKKENELHSYKREKILQLVKRYKQDFTDNDLDIETEEGKKAFYTTKLKLTEEQIPKLCSEYLKGLAWILKYYISDNSDNKWYFPYHYAPFLSDLIKVNMEKHEFAASKPISLLEQSVVVLPPHSKFLVLPKLQFIYEKYKNEFPEEIKTDHFEKFLPWQAVILLNFLNTEEIRKEISAIDLNLDEMQFNMVGKEIIYFGVNHRNFRECANIYLKPKSKYDLSHPYLSVQLLPYNESSLPNEEKWFNGENFINQSIAFTFNLPY